MVVLGLRLGLRLVQLLVPALRILKSLLLLRLPEAAM
jgi:hypothetical protein